MAETATHYELHNLMGNWKAGTWNVLPAVLTTWSNLLSLKGNQTSYELYREQARQYVDTARQNAQLIKNQGEIALRNLRYKNKLERGNDVLRIAASNSNMNGSNLDVLVRKEKVRKMNEQTLNANYTNQALMEMTNGYRQAASAYGTLAAKADADKWAAWASILKGVETYVGLQVRDAKVQSQANAGHQMVINSKEVAFEDQDNRYRFPTETETPEAIKLSGGPDVTNEGIILNGNNTIANADDYEIRFRV